MILHKLICKLIHLTAFMKIVHFIIFKLCKSLSSQVLWKKLPAIRTLYVALIICNMCHFYSGCSQLPVCCVDWKFPGGSLTIISPRGRKAALVWQVRLDWGSEQATQRQWALQAQKKDQDLKCHPLLQRLEPPVIAYSVHMASQLFYYYTVTLLPFPSETHPE